jgi:hypothetical protein
MRHSLPLLLVAVVVTLVPSPSPAALKILEGEHTVVYDIVNPRGVAFIPDYANESFVQKVIQQDEFSKRVQVTAKMHPLRSRARFPVAAGALPADHRQYLLPEKDRQADDPALVDTARELTRGSAYVHEAANAILTWIADNLTFDTTITARPDAVSAFRSRKAFCVGYSNLAVALLRAAGIPARIAHGYLPPGYEWGFSKEYWGVKVNDGGFHAYLEIFYPDTGWVFADAEHSHHFVDPFHLILRLDGMQMPGAYAGGYLDVDKATFYTIFSEVDRTVLVDELPLPKQQRLGRRMDERQHASLVSGKVSDGTGRAVAKGTAVLWKDGKGVPYPFADGVYTIAVTAPGNYRIEVRGAGYAKASQEVPLAMGQTQRRDFTLAPGGTIKGTVTDAGGRIVAEGDVFYRDGNMSFGVPLDRDGTYRLEGLAPGSYAVKLLVGDREVVRQVQVEAGKESLQNFTVR